MKIILDIDRTLADNSARAAAARKPDGKLDWKIFTEPDRVSQDALKEYDGPGWSTILAVLRWWLSRGHEIWYLSGREERLRDITSEWLRKHGFPEGPLMLREDGDRRGDAAFKGTLLNGLKEVFLAVDDCGAAYEDPGAMRLVYEVRGIPLMFPEEAFGKEFGIGAVMEAK